MRRLPLLIFAVCCVLLLLAAAVYAYQCHYWSDNTVVYYPGYGETCGSWGYGCTECWDTATGESCIELGFGNCFNEENQFPP